MDKIILVGGSPAAGKSFTAKKIAKLLKLSWISTDKIRGHMQKTLPRKKYPKLNMFTGMSAERYLSTHSASQIVKDQNTESKDVWQGIQTRIDKSKKGKSYIIEGVAILPKFVAKMTHKNKKIIAVFLIDENRERIRETIYTRGLWADADKYAHSVKEKEVAWVLAFNTYIKKEAKKYGFPVIDVGDRKAYFQKIKKIIDA
ncbi:MAG: hypothetical protein WC916_01680 [Candidatus Woesearchaeota archaeon]